MRQERILYRALNALVENPEYSIDNMQSGDNAGTLLGKMTWLDSRNQPSNQDILDQIDLLDNQGKRAEVNKERDRRINLPKPVSLSSGKSFVCDMANGAMANISDLGTAAVAKILISNDTTFSFRDANNQDHDLTNADVIEMGLQCAAQVEQIHIKAREIKAMNPIPEDVTDDILWND